MYRQQTNQVTQNNNFVFKQTENILGNGENVGSLPSIFFSHDVFKKVSAKGATKVVIVWLMVNPVFMTFVKDTL